jgi:tetratricopeptide (TPR) repeat protein
LLEALSAPEAALDAYLELARRFPYPNAYWDEALQAAARIEEERGRYGAALTHLERMLRERETAQVVGSYERPSYAAARFHIAELYRDRLADPRRARREFRRVFAEHATSPLRDDALFEEALIAVRASDVEGSCQAARLLRDQQPDSRYARCVSALCPALPAQDSVCRTYILRRIAAARTTLTEEPADAHSSSSSSSR